MLRLASLLYAIIGSSLAGAGVIVVLSMGYDTLMPILIAAGVGAVVALPFSLYVAKAIQENIR